MELWVGGIFGATVVLLGLFFLAQGFFLSPFQTFKKFSVKLDRSNDLSTGSSVKTKDMKIGFLSSVHLTDDAIVRATVKIQQKYANFIREGTVVRTGQTVVGGAHLKVIPGDLSNPKLKAGDTIPYKSSPSLRNKIRKNVDKVSSLVFSEKNSIGRLLHDQGKTYKKLGQILGNIKTTTENLESMMKKINDPERSTIGRLLQDRGNVYGTLRTTMDTATETMKNINNITGTVNETVKNVNKESHRIPDLLKQSQNLTRKTNKTLESINRTWPLNSEEQPQLDQDLSIVPR